VRDCLVLPRLFASFLSVLSLTALSACAWFLVYPSNARTSCAANDLSLRECYETCAASSCGPRALVATSFTSDPDSDAKAVCYCSQTSTTAEADPMARTFAMGTNVIRIPPDTVVYTSCPGGVTGAGSQVCVNGTSQGAVTCPPCTPDFCVHGGTCSVTGTPAAARCTDCTAGWTGARCNVDINECATNNGGCGSGLCANTQGSYECGAVPCQFQNDQFGFRYVLLGSFFPVFICGFPRSQLTTLFDGCFCKITSRSFFRPHHPHDCLQILQV
jgi:hypothetical protein